jgi:ATPases of the AAA+ class
MDSAVLSSSLGNDRDLVAQMFKAGAAGDAASFRSLARSLVEAAEARGDAALAELARSALEGGGRLEVPATDEERANAFKATLREDAEIPLGLSLVKSNVRMEHVILPPVVKQVVNEFIAEQEENELYIRNGLQPRNKMMLMGPPGNGKTALCKAIANRMGCPLYFVRYDALMSTRQGETSKRLYNLFEFVKTHRCIMFFDEVDAIGKERADENEAGDMKRVVSTLLVQLDDVPPHVIVLGATNHPQMLDKAIWRRFHIRTTLPSPGADEYEQYLRLAFGKFGHAPKKNLRILGIVLQAENFAEVEVFVEDCVRTFIRGRGSLTIEQAIDISLENWPKTRVKIPA